MSYLPRLLGQPFKFQIASESFQIISETRAKSWDKCLGLAMISYFTEFLSQLLYLSQFDYENNTKYKAFVEENY